MAQDPDIAKWLDLSGKAALVTGGGHGIGAGIAAVLARAGARVVVADIVATSAVAIAKRIGGVGLTVDVSDSRAVAAAVDGVVARFGRLDIMVNNAGLIEGLDWDVVDFTDKRWRRILAVNLDGVLYGSREAARVMLADSRGGHIINISSTQAITSGAGVAYDASKGAVSQLTRALALELGPKGIHVNAIAPGPVWTADEPRPDLSRSPPELVSMRRDAINSRLARLPAGSWALPEDIGRVALFLSSPMSSTMHGAVLAVDGGWMVI